MFSDGQIRWPGQRTKYAYIPSGVSSEESEGEPVGGAAAGGVEGVQPAKFFIQVNNI